MIRLMLVDDHAIVRRGLKQIFEIVSDIAVIAEAADGNTALERLRENDIDVLLLDMTMPGLCGEPLIARIHERHPRLSILVLSMHNESQFAQLALTAGARGYLSKDHEPEILLDAIRRIAAGGRFIDPLIAERMAFETANVEARAPHERLSDRERQIFRMIAGGMSGKQIAEELSISHKTVATHKSKLMEKMGFATNAELFRYASNNKIDV